MSLRDIAVKVLRGELPPLAEGELANERMKTCRICPEFRPALQKCNLCGCFLVLKTKILEAGCPIDKW